MWNFYPLKKHYTKFWHDQPDKNYKLPSLFLNLRYFNYKLHFYFLIDHNLFFLMQIGFKCSCVTKKVGFGQFPKIILDIHQQAILVIQRIYKSIIWSNNFQCYIPTRSICPKIITSLKLNVQGSGLSQTSTNQFGMSRTSLNVNTIQQHQPQSKRTKFTHTNSITINNNTILAPNYAYRRHRNPTTKHWLPTCFIILTKEVWQMLPYAHWNKLDNPIEYCKHTFGGPSLMGILFLHTKQSTTPMQQSLTCFLTNGCSWNP
jgi:hypothetical protein